MIRILNADDYKNIGVTNINELFKYIVENDSNLSVDDELSLFVSAVNCDFDVSFEVNMQEIKDLKIFNAFKEMFAMGLIKDGEADTIEDAKEILEEDIDEMETISFSELSCYFFELRKSNISDEEKINYLNGVGNVEELELWEKNFAGRNDRESFIESLIFEIKNDEEKYNFLNEDVLISLFKDKSDSDSFFKLGKSDFGEIEREKIKIVKSFQNDKFKLKYIDEILDVDFDMKNNFNQVYDIIDSLKDEQSILECLKNEKIVNILGVTVSDFLMKMKDKKNIIECLKEPKIVETCFYWTNVLDAFDEKGEINELKIFDLINKKSSENILILINLLEDENLILECLTNEMILDSLNESKLGDFILKIDNENLKIKILENEEIMLRISNVDFIKFIRSFPRSVEVREKITNLLSNSSIGDKLMSIQDNSIYMKILPYFEESIRDVFIKCIRSNSIEIEKLGFTMILALYQQGLTKEEINEKFKEMENIFLKNNIPYFGKMFLCFQKIYPNLSKIEGTIERFDFKDNSRMSPTLQDDFIMKLLYRNKYEEMKKEINENPDKRDAFDKKATLLRFSLIFNNLLWISVGSNNRSLREYLENIEKGNSLYLEIISSNIEFNKLNNENKKILEVFVSHLEMLYTNTKEGKESDIDLSDKTIIEKIELFKEKFKVTDRYGLPDRIVRSFCYYAGFDSFKQLKDTFEKVLDYSRSKGKKNAKLIAGKKLVLEEGDFIRGVGSLESLKCLNEGNVCKELLGIIRGSSRSDTTPLDTDWTRLLKSDIQSNIHDTINGTPTGFGFGDIFFVIKKDNPNLYITRENGEVVDNLEYKPNKVAMFSTGYDSHYGAQLGTPTLAIDYIIFNEKFIKYSNTPHRDLDRLSALKMEVVKNGIYIPIVDMEGNLVFTEKEYEVLKNKVGGLKFYNNPDYILSDYPLELPNVNIELDNDNVITIPSVENILSIMEESDKQNESWKLAIFKTLSKFVIDNTEAKKVYDEMIGNLTNGSSELLGTGSTSRGTNIPGDADYDYILRVDKKEMLKKTNLPSKLKEYLNPLEEIPGKNNRFRGKGIKNIIGCEDDEFDIDVTFIGKTNKMEYSTEMALNDRLNAIKEQYPGEYDKIRANIIVAKYLLKGAGVYKPYKSDANQGGLGGVGIENWILQNNGSLYQAIDEFLDASKDKDGNHLSFEDFKKKYHIWDFGANHETSISSYPYDDFVAFNMTEVGYEKMCTVLKLYKEQLELHKNNSYKR